MSLRDTLIEWSDGNPGAASALVAVHKGSLDEAATIMDTLNKAKSIRGSRIWILYKDLCGHDVSKMAKLCKICPVELLEKACAVEDRTGVDLIKAYLL